MADIIKQTDGYFAGRSLVQQGKTLGGARHVFYKVSKIKEELIHLTGGAQLKNPFPGAAKLYAGDLFEMRYDDKVENPELYALKTYLVVNASGSTVNIVRDAYKHIPFVGDNLGVAPEKIGGAMTPAKITAVEKTEVSGVKVWKITFDKAVTAQKDDVLVEADADGNMLVKRVNQVAPYDYDFMYSQAADPTADDEFEAARYFMTPVTGGEMYIHRMSPMPKCVLDLNLCNINGVFKVDAFLKPYAQYEADKENA